MSRSPCSGRHRRSCGRGRDRGIPGALSAAGEAQPQLGDGPTRAAAALKQLVAGGTDPAERHAPSGVARPGPAAAMSSKPGQPAPFPSPGDRRKDDRVAARNKAVGGDEDEDRGAHGCGSSSSLPARYATAVMVASPIAVACATAERHSFSPLRTRSRRSRWTGRSPAPRRPRPSPVRGLTTGPVRRRPRPWRRPLR